MFSTASDSPGKYRQAPSRLPEWLAALVVGLLLSLAVVSSLDLEGRYKLALLGGALGAVFLLYFPRRRMLLVCAWVFLHPLSIEKIFFLGRPLEAVGMNFLPPVMVVSASDVMMAALGVALLAESLFYGNRSAWRWPAAMTPYAALVIWSIIVFFLRKPDGGSTLAVIHDLKMALFMLVMVSAVRTPGELKLLLYCLCLAVLLQVALVGLSAATGSAIRISAKLSKQLMEFSGSGQAVYFRATGTVGQVNQEACFLTFFGIPLLALLFSTGRFWKVTGLITLLGVMAAVGLTYSRSAWLSLLIGGAAVLTIAYVSRTLRFRYWIYLVPFLLLGTALLPFFGKSAMDRLINGDEGATASRERDMRLAWDLFCIHPLAGVGTGNFARATLKYYPPQKETVTWLNPGQTARIKWRYSGRLELTQVKDGEREYDIPLPVHNKYLLVMTELGAIGLILFIWFQVRIFKHITSSLKSGDNMIRWLAIGVGGAFFASQCYMNLDLFADDKTMQLLLMIPVLAMITDQISFPFRKDLRRVRNRS